MASDTLIGKVRYEVSGTKAGTYGQYVPESLEATYITVLAPVGANHHMIQHQGAIETSVVPNSDLVGKDWWPSVPFAQEAFERFKAKRIAER